ncbi:thioredoxin family protein [Danxiaibacter flavus]|uniref:Thioredoxin family protein n=1 Tax=Danxiaibacter flavus TaxID=3049108 RepID=A0ABV3ZP11_9BACT|nr:thioredoxin family protein [Chitinophagaceae bacterium DXS]
MKKIILMACCALTFTLANGQSLLERAQKEAKEMHKLILLNFSGSDWCIPCIKMHKEFFENDDFKKAGDSLLVFLNADFPRLKKHQPDEATQKENEWLADKYNQNGAFPYTILLDGDGKVLKSWNGLPACTPAEFTREIVNNYAAYYK